MKRATAVLAILFSLCLLPGIALADEKEVETLPDFTFTTLEGKTFSRGDFEGKPMVVIMLASWCPPCKREAPDIEKAYLEYKNQGVVFLGVFSASSEKGIREFAKKYGLTFPVGTGEGFSELFGWKPFPAAAFVGRDGAVRGKHFSQISYEELSKGIEGMLK